MSLLDDEEIYRLNAFDWESEFSEIMKKGGFDAVIGNPPYGFHQIHENFVKPYFKKKFVSSSGSFEHYFLFYEKSLKLLKRNGLHGFIVPVTWLTIPSAQSLRKMILDNYWIKEICWLPELVFENAQVNTLVSIIQYSSNNKNVAIKIYDTLGFQNPAKRERNSKQSNFINSDYYIAIFEGSQDSKVIQKINSLSIPLKDIAKPCSGYNPYEVGKGQAPKGGPQTIETVKTKPYHSEENIGDEWRPKIIGRNLDRYHVNVTQKRWIKYGPWLAAPRDPENFKGKRILVQEITGGKKKRIVAAYYENELYYSRDVIPVKIANKFPHPFYLLSIINSLFISWYHLKRNPKAQKGLSPKVLVSDLKKLPIPNPVINSIEFKTQHDHMVLLVTKIMDLKKQMYDAKLPHIKTTIQRQIESTDKQIDQLVYKLYKLTDEEIKIVESET